jgi:hypothetical protein
MFPRVALAVAMLSCGMAAADEVPTDARAVFKRAETAFALGRFSEAADLFEKVFELKQDPVVLYDAAQAHRLAGNKQKALILYQNYVRMFGERNNSQEVEKRISDLKAAIDAERAATNNPPTTILREGKQPEPQAEPTPEPATTEPTPAPAGVVATEAPPPKKPLAKRGWFWGVVAGSVVVVGAAVVLGVVLGSPGSAPPVTLGSVRGN